MASSLIYYVVGPNVPDKFYVTNRGLTGYLVFQLREIDLHCITVLPILNPGTTVKATRENDLFKCK